MKSEIPPAPMKILLFANTAWYLYNFRLALARRLRDEGYEVVLVSPPDAYGDRLEKEGFRWRGIPMRRQSLNPLREIVLLARLARLYRDEKPDIVHHFTIKCAIYGAVVAWIADVPATVNAVAGLGFVFISQSARARILRPLLRAMMRWTFARPSSLLILQNRDDVEAMVRTKTVEPSRIRLIRSSGVDTERFRPAGEKAESVDTEKRILFCSRLLWSKGVGEYIEAARILGSEGVKARFRLAGAPDSGNPESITQDVLACWAAEGVTEILGHVEDTAKEMTRSDVFVLPSYYGEGVPRCLIEAAACAIPLIATDMAGCREIVVHEETGLLVPPRDAAALAHAVRRLCDDSKLARRLGLAAREKALAEFDEHAVLNSTLDVYGEFIPKMSVRR